MILSVTLNPSVDRASFLDKLLLGDTNRVLRTETDAGGKGINVARVAVELGAEALCLGFLGGGTGGVVRHALDAEGVPYNFTEIQGETRMNFSIEDDSGGPPTTLNEPGPEVSQVEHKGFLAALALHLPTADFVTLGGSLPQGLPASTFAALLQSMPGKRVVVDADGEPLKLALAEKPFMVKPNAHEAERLLGVSVSGMDGALAAARRLREMGVQIAIVSLGDVGAAMASEQGDFEAVPPNVKALSTIGSGDSLIGGFLAALSKGDSHEEALRLGVAAGAATATTDGSGICRKQMVMELLGGVRIRKAA